MASLEMGSLYDFNSETIDKVITKTSAGNYALGYLNDKTNKFVVKYVGRSDTDLKRRLKQHIGEKYTLFKYLEATSPMRAFQKECQNYHDFGESDKLDNENHPAKPENTDWKCPCCGV